MRGGQAGTTLSTTDDRGRRLTVPPEGSGGRARSTRSAAQGSLSAGEGRGACANTLDPADPERERVPYHG
jgi:hypothetical protein